MFVDKATIKIKSGKGGNGAVSFRREAFIPQGGPDGGNGGRGGNVIFEVDSGLRTLMDFRYKTEYRAENGEDGRGKRQFGKDGQDLVIKVPEGTVIRDAENGLLMADLKDRGARFVAARGGRGGRGNDMFKNSVRRAPNFAEAGGAARERTVILELKMIADVGLVGFPNVGKSTLLSVSTNANPKIAGYHFTTLTPNLGVVQLFDKRFVMADIPGIIEGASEGAGLGLDFLKHIERTRIIIHVVDVSGSEGRDPKDDFDKINAELKTYSTKLADKPQIVCANKMDICPPGKYEEFKEYVNSKAYEVYPCSAPISQGVEDLLKAALKLLLSLPEEEDIPIKFEDIEITQEADYRKINIEKTAQGFLLTGKQLEKIFNSTNFNDSGSLRYLYRYIEDSGAKEEMLRMGLEEGDTVTIIDYDFEYYDD